MWELNRTGWICPRCDKVISPTEKECLCHLKNKKSCVHTFWFIDDDDVAVPLQYCSDCKEPHSNPLIGGINK